MDREIKFQFIIDNKVLSKVYTLDEVLDMEKEKVFMDMEVCSCSFNESTMHCDCGQVYDQSTITGKRQYTGLKDKNGKEVYEGDIVSFEKGNADVVEFSGNEYVRKSKYGNHYPFRLHHYYEIIGNIYETPNLINP